MSVIFYAYVDRYGKADNLQRSLKTAIHSKNTALYKYSQKPESIISQLTKSKYTGKNGKGKLVAVNYKRPNTKALKNSFQSDFMINELDESHESQTSPMGNFSETVSLSDKVSCVIVNNAKKESWRDKFEVFKMIYTVPMI
jgi:hypothetical protein